MCPHHALQGGVRQGRPVPVEVRPHVQIGAQQVHGRIGISHNTQMAVQVAVDVLASEGKSEKNTGKKSKTPV